MSIANMRPPVRDVFLNAKDSWRGVARIYRPTVCLVARKGAITRNYSVAPPKERYGAIVVGAGPAGIATVGNLLDSGVESVKWLDPSFNGGRLNAKYREVPRYGLLRPDHVCRQLTYPVIQRSSSSWTSSRP